MQPHGAAGGGHLPPKDEEIGGAAWLMLLTDSVSTCASSKRRPPHFPDVLAGMERDRRAVSRVVTEQVFSGVLASRSACIAIC